MEILLSITFVYGVVRLLSFTPLIQKTLTGVIESIFTAPNTKTAMGRFIIHIDYVFLYFSLCFQAWWWLFKN